MKTDCRNKPLSIKAKLQQLIGSICRKLIEIAAVAAAAVFLNLGLEMEMMVIGKG